MKKQPIPKVIGILIILAGIAHAAYYLNFARRAEVVEAMVVDSQLIAGTKRVTGRSRGARASRLLTIEFAVPSGDIVTSEISVTSTPTTPRKGESLEVQYLPSSPQTVRLNTWLATWGTGFIISLSGLAFWILSTFLMKSKKIPARRLLRMRLPRL